MKWLREHDVECTLTPGAVGSSVASMCCMQCCHCSCSRSLFGAASRPVVLADNGWCEADYVKRVTAIGPTARTAATALIL